MRFLPTHRRKSVRRTCDSGLQPLRRRFLSLVASSICLAGGLVAPASAQPYPAKAVRIVVNSPPGGVVDKVARVLAFQLQRALGRILIVENRSAGNGNVGAAEVARAAADGYTLLLSPSSVIAANDNLRPKLPYDPMKDLMPIASLMVFNSYLVVRPDAPVYTLREFLSHLRASPGKLKYGTPGNGTPPHLAAELLMRETGVDAVHVPYKGYAPALADLLAGRVDFMFDPGPGVAQIQSEKLRLLAVAGPARAAAFPDTPTVAEVIGKAFDAATLVGVLAPAGTPQEVIARLDAELARAMKEPEVLQRIAEVGGEPLYLGPGEFADRLERIHAQMGALVRDGGLTAE